jgi:hypothetical protein
MMLEINCSRAILTCFKDLSLVIEEAIKSPEPGRSLELQDRYFPFQYIGEPLRDSALYKWNEKVVAGGAKSSANIIGYRTRDPLTTARPETC